MPLYEYECKQCKKHTEHIQKFSDPEITECPHCGGLLQRVVTAAAISFKGGGWYKDGYSSAKPSASTTESSSSTPATSSNEASSTPNKETTSAPSAPTTPAPAAAPAPAASTTT